MAILAIEQSSDTGSIALLNEEKVISERSWDGYPSRGSGFFLCLKDLMLSTSLSLSDIDHYVVDIGPGSYGGLRSSLAAVRAMAMPDKKPVYALTSAETIAFEVMRELSSGLIQVVGDARRRQLWHCLYKNIDGMPLAQSGIQLAAENDFQPDRNALIASPDWHRLNAKLLKLADGGASLIKKSCVPKAACLGRLACQKIKLDIPGEALRPIYLHAAVEGVQGSRLQK